MLNDIIVLAVEGHVVNSQGSCTKPCQSCSSNIVDILILYEESRADSGMGITIMNFFLLVVSSFVGLTMAHLRCVDVHDTTSSHRLSIESPQRASTRLTSRCPHNYGPKGTCAGRRKHNVGTADCEPTYYFIVRIRFCRLDQTFGLI
jgi:hypothetical protein